MGSIQAPVPSWPSTGPGSAAPPRPSVCSLFCFSIWSRISQVLSCGWVLCHLTCNMHKALMIVFLCSLMTVPQGLTWLLTITCGPSIGLSLISQLRAFTTNRRVIVCPVLVCVLGVSCAGLCPRCVLCLFVSGYVLYWLVSGMYCVSPCPVLVCTPVV